MKTQQLVFNYRVWYRIPELFGNRMLSVAVAMPRQIRDESQKRSLERIIAGATVAGKTPRCNIARIGFLKVSQEPYSGSFCVLKERVEQPGQRSNQKSMMQAIRDLKRQLNPGCKSPREVELRHRRRLVFDRQYRQQFQSGLKQTGANNV